MTLIKIFSAAIILMAATVSVLLLSNQSPGKNPALSEEKVKQLTLENAIQTLPNYQFSILKVEKQDDKWHVQIKAVKNDPNCPNVLIREYFSPPFDNFRDEKRIVNCKINGNLIFEEEAIIASQGDPDVKKIMSDSATSKAIKFTPSTFATLSQCTGCFYDDMLLELSARGLDASQKTFFVVEWSNEKSRVLIALDEKAGIIGKVL